MSSDACRGRAADQTPGHELASAYRNPGESVEPPPAVTPEDVVEAAHLQAESQDRDAALPPLFERRRTPGQPPPLDSVPGLIDEFVAWVLDQAPRPQPAIFQATGLALLGALTGRQFQTRTGLRGNVFFLVIAGTGSGKDAAIGAARRLAKASDCAAYVAGDPGSFRGYQRFLADHPARLFPIDELGKLMRAAQRESSGPTRATLDFLLRLYSHSVAGGELPAHVVAKETDCTPAVSQACASLVGFSTEEAWEALTPTATSDGWLPRFVLVEGDPEARLGQGGFVAPPSSLVAALRRVADDLPGHDYRTAGQPRMRHDVAPDCFTLKEERAVQRLDETVRHASDDWAREAVRASRPWLAELIARWRENGLKLAMLRATSRWSTDKQQERPYMLAEDFLWGLALAEDSIRRMSRALADRVGANEHELLVKRVRRAIERASGADGWACRSLLRKALGGGRVSTRDFDAAIETLEDLEEVEALSAPAGGTTGGGRPRRVYRLTPRGHRQLEN